MKEGLFGGFFVVLFFVVFCLVGGGGDFVFEIKIFMMQM